MISSAVLIYLFKSTFASCLVLSLIQLAYFIYFIITRPFKDKMLNIFVGIIEGIIFILMLIMLIFSKYSEFGRIEIANSSKKVLLTDLMMSLIIIILVLHLIALIAYICYLCKAK